METIRTKAYISIHRGIDTRWRISLACFLSQQTSILAVAFDATAFPQLLSSDQYIQRSIACPPCSGESLLSFLKGRIPVPQQRCNGLRTSSPRTSTVTSSRINTYKQSTMSTTIAPTHVPCSGPSSRSQQSSSSRFQQLLQAKIAAEKVDGPSAPLPPPTQAQAPIGQAYSNLSTADTVFNPSFMGQHYAQPATFGESKTEDIPAEDISAAFRSVTTERIASMFADTQEQAKRQDWGMESNAMYPPSVPIKQEAGETYHQNPMATPLQSRPVNMSAHPDYTHWRERGLSPQSVASTPSLMDSSSIGLPPTPLLAHTPATPQLDSRVAYHRQSMDSMNGSPSSAQLPYGMSAFTGMNGQIQVPGIVQAASHEGDSLNLNNLGGDANGGYDQGGYGGDGGYGGNDGYGDNGNGGYGPPGGNGAGGSGGDGNDPGEGPPPPPKGKKLQLACHFCRRRKLK